jgi:hypothetical protein
MGLIEFVIVIVLIANKVQLVWIIIHFDCIRCLWLQWLGIQFNVFYNGSSVFHRIHALIIKDCNNCLECCQDDNNKQYIKQFQLITTTLWLDPRHFVS